ncbi:hypothetical protein [Hymenobacter persicinus]|uniref:Uncharacterized protein n=1 Tax=Hymenobacter persicinus TaxID=2025506 RepID=A0A4Q5LFP4_9BACT|nr:hypothetical protein [Hymenobacter persicinus]RYU81817.1 hypothetical protein EWM57_05405 [Hymenobacter persicinus]
MQNKVLILAALLFTGCGPDRVTEYSCHGTFVTRVDKGATSQFFYGTYAQASGQPAVVETHYPGFDGLMDAYLTFKGKQVEIQPAGGYFETKTPHKNLSITDRDNSVFPDWLDSIRSDMSHTVYLAANLEYETKRNQQYRSGVKATTVQVGFLSSF